jgi:hypothetical protein
MVSSFVAVAEQQAFRRLDAAAGTAIFPRLGNEINK